MGQAIANRLGGGTVWELDPASGLFKPLLRLGDSSGEQVFILNWVEESDYGSRGFSEAAADAFLAALIRHQQLHPEPFFLNKIRLIGHSRGCVVNSELVERFLGIKGKENFQSFTPTENSKFAETIETIYLDPHPIGAPGWFENIAVLPANSDLVNPDLGTDPVNQVIAWAGGQYYADYFQTKTSAWPQGIEIPHTYRRDIGGLVDGSGGNDHSLTHTWFMGTIDPSASDDGDGGDISTYRAKWYPFDRKGIIHGFGHTPAGGSLRDAARQEMTPANSADPGPIQAPVWSWPNNAAFNLSPNISAPNRMFGGMEYIDFPGWSFQGGETVVGLGLTLESPTLLPGKRYIHNWFYLPSTATEFRFNLANTCSGDLKVSLIDMNGNELNQRTIPVSITSGTITTENIPFPITDLTLPGSVVKIVFSWPQGSIGDLKISNIRLN